jgi:FkbM family methyltransferase
MSTARDLVYVALVLSAACVDEQHRGNTVDDALLRPRVLDDVAAMQRYVDDFPFDEYTITTVEGTRFYLDAIDDVIKNELRNGVAWERRVDDALFNNARENTTVIDAGAHIGTHTMTLARRVGSEGRVYAFEPQKKIFRELVQNVRLNRADNVVPLRFALGDQNDVVIAMRPAQEHNEGGTGVSKSFGGSGDRAELRTIDSFWFQNVSLIKIDVEGFEDHVLDGARETILMWRPVIIIEIMGGEDHDNPSPRVKARIERTVNKLVELDYFVERFGPHDYIAIPASL